MISNKYSIRYGYSSFFLLLANTVNRKCITKNGILRRRKNTRGNLKGGEKKELPVPNEVRIGGSLDGEVDNATKDTLQDSTVACSVSSSQRL